MGDNVMRPGDAAQCITLIYTRFAGEHGYSKYRHFSTLFVSLRPGELLQRLIAKSANT
jgi:hypothetical protein